MKWLRRAGYVLVVSVVAALIIWHRQFWWWAEVHTGTVNEPGPYYGFFSGFGSDLGELAIIGGLASSLALFWRHTNCHVKGCPRVGRFPLAGGEFKVCGHHNPEFSGHHPTLEHILERHRLHKEKAGHGSASVQG